MLEELTSDNMKSTVNLIIRRNKRMRINYEITHFKILLYVSMVSRVFSYTKTLIQFERLIKVTVISVKKY